MCGRVDGNIDQHRIARDILALFTGLRVIIVTLLLDLADTARFVVLV